MIGFRYVPSRWSGIQGYAIDAIGAVDARSIPPPRVARRYARAQGVVQPGWVGNKRIDRKSKRCEANENAVASQRRAADSSMAARTNAFAAQLFTLRAVFSSSPRTSSNTIIDSVPKMSARAAHSFL